MESAARPKLVFIFGPAAVGKMTVGQQLAEVTGFKLLYNHMVVDLVTQFFSFGSPPFHSLARPMTQQLIEACADNDVSLIITQGRIKGDQNRDATRAAAIKPVSAASAYMAPDPSTR